MGAGRDLYGLRSNGTEVQIEIGLNPISISGEEHALAAIIDITAPWAPDENFSVCAKTAASFRSRSGSIR
jgi:hypothetical protein